MPTLDPTETPTKYPTLDPIHPDDSHEQYPFSNPSATGWITEFFLTEPIELVVTNHDLASFNQTEFLLCVQQPDAIKVATTVAAEIVSGTLREEFFDDGTTH